MALQSKQAPENAMIDILESAMTEFHPCRRHQNGTESGRNVRKVCTKRTPQMRHVLDSKTLILFAGVHRRQCLALSQIMSGLIEKSSACLLGAPLHLAHTLAYAVQTQRGESKTRDERTPITGRVNTLTIPKHILPLPNMKKSTICHQ